MRLSAKIAAGVAVAALGASGIAWVVSDLTSPSPAQEVHLVTPSGATLTTVAATTTTAAPTTTVPVTTVPVSSTTAPTTATTTGGTVPHPSNTIPNPVPGGPTIYNSYAPPAVTYTITGTCSQVPSDGGWDITCNVTVTGSDGVTPTGQVVSYFGAVATLSGGAARLSAHGTGPAPTSTTIGYRGGPGKSADATVPVSAG